MKQTRAQVLEVSQLTAEQMDIELLKGYTDMLEGRTKSAENTFSDIRKDYNLWFTMFREMNLSSYKKEEKIVDLSFLLFDSCFIDKFRKRSFLWFNSPIMSLNSLTPD